MMTSNASRRFVLFLILLGSLAAPLLAQVATPVITPPSRIGVPGAGVILTCTTASTTIHYTTNGVDPTSSDPTYSSPIAIYTACTLKAKAFTSSASSSVASAVFTGAGSIAAGADFAFSIRFDGLAMSWGNTGSGQLGWSTGSGPTAVPGNLNTSSGAGSLTGVYQITAGAAGGMALVSDGAGGTTVKSWGANTSYQLGINNTTTTLTKNYTVQVLDNNGNNLTNVSMIASGNNFNLALIGSGTNASEVYGWGKNDLYQLGLLDTTSRAEAAPVKADTSGTIFTGAIAIAAGQNHSMALKSDGTVWVWGDNSYAQFLSTGGNPKQHPGQKTGLSSIVFIASGNNHCMAIDSSGKLYTWGANASGQLGNGTTATKQDGPYTPTGMTSGVVMAAGGALYTLVLKSDGTVWAFGDDQYGQLGDGNSGTGVKSLVPVQVKLNSTTYLTNIVAVECGASFSMALGADGTIYTWGSNSADQLATTGSSYTPYAVASSNLGKQSAQPPTVSLSVSPNSSVTELGNFQFSATVTSAATGNNTSSAPIQSVSFSENGVSLGTDTTAPYNLSWSSVPTGNYLISAQATDVDGVTGSPTTTTISVTNEQVSVAAGASVPEGQSNTTAFTFTRPAPTYGSTNKALTIYYTMESGGTHQATYGADYTLSFGGPSGSVTMAQGVNSATVTLTALTDRLTEGPETATLDITPGSYGVATSSATVTIIDVPPVADPTFYPSVNNLAKASVVSITSATAGSTIFYTTDGTSPTHSGASPTGTAKAISSGSLIHLTPGVAATIKAIGYEAGDLDSNLSTISYTGVADVFPADYHNFAILNDTNHTAWAWGDNAQGQLGLGNSNVDWNPQPLPAFNNAVSFAGIDSDGDSQSVTSYLDGSQVYSSASTSSNNLSVAVKSDGTVWAWGQFQYKLGDTAQTAVSLTPVQVSLPAGTVATKVVANTGHVVILTAAGNVYDWGDNTNSDLGNSTGSSPTPLEVKTSGSAYLSGIVDIAAGQYHNLALKNDGTIWAWGLNSSGQLGNNTTISSSVAVEVVNSSNQPITNFVAIAAGANHSLAIKSDSSLWGWGDGSVGQLGSLNSSSNYPVQATTAGGSLVSGFISVAAYGNSSYGTKIDGTQWGWGDGSAGQFGIGARAYSVTVIGDQSSISRGLTVKAGPASVFTLQDSSALWATGQNKIGQLGDGSFIDELYPALVNLNYPDSDGDGIQDWKEVDYFNTNPFAWDTNGDGLSDLQDIQRGINPTQPYTFVSVPSPTPTPTPNPGDHTAPTIQLTEPTGATLTTP